ncbi:MAG TPA: PhnD/SsuA/transferrin family substrate-binding protein [Casimicrobiaceae bacterium]
MIANARMYAVNGPVAALWERLFAWISARADVPLDVVAHAAPRPLADLWRRVDLGCTFMCGYPWSTWRDDAAARPLLLGAPRPSAARYGGRAVYCTDIVVRADSTRVDVDGLRGARFAYTVESSQSGWQAPRHLFAEAAIAAGGRFFGAIVGPLHTPRAIADALIEGRADAGPLDSYWLDLLRRHEPATAMRLRTLGSTPMTASPPLVCAASAPQDMRERLASALHAVADDPSLADLRGALLLDGFAAADADGYASLARRARATDALGYPRLQ